MLHIYTSKLTKFLIIISSLQGSMFFVLSKRNSSFDNTSIYVISKIPYAECVMVQTSSAIL